MDFNQFFKGFFGFGPHNRRGSFENSFPQEPFDPWSDEDDEADSQQHAIDPFFNNSSVNLFQHLEDMFNNMFSASFGVLDFPRVEITVPNEHSPRDAMLRDSPSCQQSPFCHTPFAVEEQEPLIDKDLDDQVAKGGLFSLKEPGPIKPIQHHNFSFSKSFSVRTVRLPDGTVEEHRTSTDSEGNKITTVRRCIGDQSHEVTTHRNKDGLQEKQENFINMDENDISSFDKMWQKRKNNSLTDTPPTADIPLKSGSPKLPVPSGDPTYLSLFKKFFSPAPDK